MGFKLPIKQTPTLDLADLPDDILITFRRGDNQVTMSKNELILELTRSYSKQGKRVRRKEHNDIIGITQCFNAVWKALVEDGDSEKADKTLNKALNKYDHNRLLEGFTSKLESKTMEKGCAKVRRFLNKHMEI